MALLRKGPKPAVSLALSICATIVALGSIATLALGQGTHGWVHWLCSPSVLGSAAHTVRASGIGAKVLTALEIHWPHFVPALLGLATLVYLWRANVRYQAHALSANNGQRPGTPFRS